MATATVDSDYVQLERALLFEFRAAVKDLVEGVRNGNGSLPMKPTIGIEINRQLLEPFRPMPRASDVVFCSECGAEHERWEVED